MILPSKELLSEILDIEEGYIELARCDKDSTICYQYTRNANTEDESIEYHFVNIYELAHKVKEWAVKQHKENKENSNGNHFYLNHFGSTLVGFFENYQAEIGYRGTDRDGDWADLQIIFTERTEPEAIFRAGEWILGKLNG